MEWNSKLYNESQQFVAEYGKGLLEFVPDKADKILDLGCGTGTLTNQLAQRCTYVLGIDSSNSMIEEAQKSYPDLEFATVDALEMSYECEWDVVFSNAVFHWIGNHDLLLKRVFSALKPGGKLICEFGAHGNIALIENGFRRALEKAGVKYAPKFNFPTKDDFGALLVDAGFTIDQICTYDRPTPLKDGEQGLIDWATQFYQSELAPLSPEQRDVVLSAMVDSVRSNLWNGTCWVADYKRLMVVATK